MMRKIGIIGAGTMGHGIAESFAMHGYEVNLFDVHLDALEKAQSLIEQELAMLAEEGLIVQAELPKILGKIKLFTDLKQTVGDRDYVIECAPENMELKKNLFKQLDELCPAKTILAKRFYLVFLGASLFAKYMDDSGAAKKIALAIMSRVGKDKPFPMLVAIWVITSILTYGGVNLWVVAFALIPIALPIFKEMNLPWHLCLAPFMLGLGTATMTMFPGTPAIQNIMPTKYLGTTAAAAPLIGVVSSVICSVLGLYYTKWALKKTQQRGESFAQPDNLTIGNVDKVELPSLLVSIIPPAALLIILNVFKIDIVYSLLAGTLLCIVLFYKHIGNHLDTLNKGAVNTILPLVNTCADVGFGKVVAATTGFTIAVNALMDIPGHPLISMAVATNLLAGLTGSGSGGLGIALEVLIPKYQALGINPEIIHRIASMSCGGLDTMPHNGAVITILAVFGLTHKTGYKHMFATCVVVPLITLVPAIMMAILFY